MPHIDETLLKGFRILYEEWGAGYKSSLIRPLLPTEDMGAFLDPPPHQVLKRLSQEIGTVSTKRLFHHVLSLSSKEEQLKLVESLGFPETQGRFFYLEAAYTLVPLCWKDIQKEDEVIELLVYNLFAYNYLSHECVPYLLLILQIPLDQLFPLLEKLLDDKNWLIRAGVVSFFYGLRDERYYDKFITPLRVSRKQWEQIRTLLERRLAVETNQEVKNLIEGELSFIGGKSVKELALPVMHIYQSNRKITSKKFVNFFYIRRIVPTDELYWIADNEPVPCKGPSGLQVWIRGASIGGEIHYVLPDWQLIVDGIVLPRGFYGDTIYVGGRNVELQYNDYRFVCSFPANKDRPPTKIEDLRPGFLADEA